MKKYHIIIALLGLSLNIYASDENLCDTLEANGGSVEAVKTCRERLGESKAYRNRIKAQEDARREAVIEDLARANREAAIIRKEFNESELLEAGFGNPFYAQEVKYSYNHGGILSMKDGKRLTRGDALCKYLGYDKAEVSRIKDELIDAEAAHHKGLIVSTNWLGNHSKEPSLYDIKGNYDHGVKTYESIVCLKLKDGASEDILKGIAEQVILINTQINTVQNAADSQNADDVRVYDSGRNSRNIVGRHVESPARFNEFLYNPNNSGSGSSR